jgi:Rrf2 family protein
MRICTRTRYGARALAELAAAYPVGPVPLRELARSQRLSVKYLEQIMARLKSAGLVRAVRGMRGGYTLTVPPGEVNLSDVFRALEGGPLLVKCVARPDICVMHEGCPTRDTWVELGEAITKFLRGTTLQGLAERRASKDHACAPSYQI